MTYIKEYLKNRTYQTVNHSAMRQELAHQLRRHFDQYADLQEQPYIRKNQLIRARVLVWFCYKLKVISRENQNALYDWINSWRSRKRFLPKMEDPK